MTAPKKKKSQKPAAASAGSNPSTPEDLLISIAPTAAGKLSDTGLQRLAARNAEQGLPGWQSLGKDSKPSHSATRQGPRERKVRW